MSDYQPYGRRASARRRVHEEEDDDDDDEEEEEEEPEFEEAYRAALRPFWAAQKQEVSQAGTDMAEFKNQQLPLARIKKIMKSDEDVRMISAEAPVLFAKACEMFILDLTVRGWVHAEDSRRRTLLRSDIAACVAHWEMLDFLADVVPQEDPKPEGAAAVAAGGSSGGDPGPSNAAAVPEVPALPPPASMYPYSMVAASMQQPQPQQQQALPSPTAAMLDEGAVQVTMFQQWQAEGQAAATQARGGAPQ